VPVQLEEAVLTTRRSISAAVGTSLGVHLGAAENCSVRVQCLKQIFLIISRLQKDQFAIEVTVRKKKYI
jgi:hypothetical protein